MLVEHAVYLVRGVGIHVVTQYRTSPVHSTVFCIPYTRAQYPESRTRIPELRAQHTQADGVPGSSISSIQWSGAGGAEKWVIVGDCTTPPQWGLIRIGIIAMALQHTHHTRRAYKALDRAQDTCIMAMGMARGFFHTSLTQTHRYRFAMLPAGIIGNEYE